MPSACLGESLIILCDPSGWVFSTTSWVAAYGADAIPYMYTDGYRAPDVADLDTDLYHAWLDAIKACKTPAQRCALAKKLKKADVHGHARVWWQNYATAFFRRFKLNTKLDAYLADLDFDLLKTMKSLETSEVSNT
jgi:hypothetical protein